MQFSFVKFEDLFGILGLNKKIVLEVRWNAALYNQVGDQFNRIWES